MFSFNLKFFFFCCWVFEGFNVVWLRIWLCKPIWCFIKNQLLCGSWVYWSRVIVCSLSLHWSLVHVSFDASSCLLSCQAVSTFFNTNSTMCYSIYMMFISEFLLLPYIYICWIEVLFLVKYWLLKLSVKISRKSSYNLGTLLFVKTH
jgi:hypothetical protein